MAPKVKIYDTKEITLAFFATLIDSGFAAGEFLRMTQNQKDFTMVVGTDGEVTRTKTNDRSVVIVVTLMQTSEGNTKLTVINNLDRAKSNGAGVGPFMIKDKSGLALYTGTGWIAAPPEVVYTNQGEARAWTIEGVLDKRFDGGS